MEVVSPPRIQLGGCCTAAPVPGSLKIHVVLAFCASLCRCSPCPSSPTQLFKANLDGRATAPYTIRQGGSTSVRARRSGACGGQEHACNVPLACSFLQAPPKHPSLCPPVRFLLPAVGMGPDWPHRMSRRCHLRRLLLPHRLLPVRVHGLQGGPQHQAVCAQGERPSMQPAQPDTVE